jgi:hypothetical protein
MITRTNASHQRGQSSASPLRLRCNIHNLPYRLKHSAHIIIIIITPTTPALARPTQRQRTVSVAHVVGRVNSIGTVADQQLRNGAERCHLRACEAAVGNTESNEAKWSAGLVGAVIRPGFPFSIPNQVAGAAQSARAVHAQLTRVVRDGATVDAEQMLHARQVHILDCAREFFASVPGVGCESEKGLPAGLPALF